MWRAVAALTAHLGLGCSFQLSLPPEQPALRTARAANECGVDSRYGNPIKFPVVDTVSAVGGAALVVSAAHDEDASRRDRNRVLGYGIAGVFGAGAVYGYYVVAKCNALRSEVAERQAAETAARVRSGAGFPESVFDFRFRSSLGEAERVCLASGRIWERDGVVASCQGSLKAARADEVELEFELGERSDAGCVDS